MKTGRSLNELAAVLKYQHLTKKDYLADTRALHLEPAADGSVLLHGIDDGLPLLPIAHAQLADNLRISKPYYNRLLALAPDLLAINVNRWLHAQSARWLVRTLADSVRAFLSDSFRPLDNFDLAEAVLPKLAEVHAVVVSCEITPSHFYLKAVMDEVRGEVQLGDVVESGLAVSNSEVGQGSLRVEALDYRLVCTNGMVRPIRGVALCQSHLKPSGRGKPEEIEAVREFVPDEDRMAEDRAFFQDVRKAVETVASRRRFENRLDQYRAAAARKMTGDPARGVETAARRFGLSKEEKATVLRYLLQVQDFSAWGLANAITRTAQDQEDYDRATELETLGGRVVELRESEWAAMAV